MFLVVLVTKQLGCQLSRNNLKILIYNDYFLNKSIIKTPYLATFLSGTDTRTSFLSGHDLIHSSLPTPYNKEMLDSARTTLQNGERI